MQKGWLLGFTKWDITSFKYNKIHGKSNSGKIHGGWDYKGANPPDGIGHKSITRYGGVNEDEFVAEHMIAWLMGYDTLVVEFPKIAALMDDLINGVI